MRPRVSTGELPGLLPDNTLNCPLFCRTGQAQQGQTMGLFSGRRPKDLGVRNGLLKPVPDSPNAVSSQATGGYHRIEPLRYNGAAEPAMAALKSIIESMPRTNIVEERADYLYAEFTSRLVGYVDDVEFYFPPNERVIHVRSASRLGHSDFGVNRKRIEDIRAKLAAAGV
jgi:uncharacterized protein (DUF1499 family)